MSILISLRRNKQLLGHQKHSKTLHFTLLGAKVTLVMAVTRL